MILNVINLKRRPDRLSKFMINNEHVKQYIHIFDAIDGNNIDLNKLEEQKLINGPFKTMNKYIIANGLSQRELWLKCIESNENYIIFEDDAIIRKDFIKQYNNLINQCPNFDILYFGYNFDSIIHFEFLDSMMELKCFFNQTTVNLNEFSDLTTPVYPFRTKNNFGVPGYIISPTGAKKLLQLCFPMEEKKIYIPALKCQTTTYTLDIIINYFFDKLNPYICFPPLVITPNNKDDSDCTKFDR